MDRPESLITHVGPLVAGAGSHIPTPMVPGRFRHRVRQLPVREGGCAGYGNAGSAIQGFMPGFQRGRNEELASHRIGATIERIASVMWAKSIVRISSDGRW